MKTLSHEERRVLTQIVNDKRVTEDNLDLQIIFIVEKVQNGFVVIAINGKKKKHIAKNYEDVIKVMQQYQ